MIILVCGLLGSGKTLLLTYFASLEKKTNIYANFNIKVPNFKRVSPSELENIIAGLLLIDEAYSWLESRTSGSIENRYLTNRVGFNSRKRELTVVVSAQILSSIDVRFRKLAEYIIMAMGYSKKYDGYVYYISDRVTTRIFVLPMKTAKKLYKIYDTLEVESDSAPTEFEPDRLNEYINNFVELVEKEYGDKMYNFSKSMINDLILEKQKQGKNKIPPSRRTIERIYARIKRKKLEND